MTRTSSRRSALLLALSGFGSLGAQSAAANDIGFYAGGSIGLAAKDAGRAELDAFVEDVHAFYGYTPVAGGASFDDSGTAFSVLVGYRLMPYLALEAAYARIEHLVHDSRTSGNFPMDAGTVNVTTEGETSGFSLSALGVWPINYQWELYARGGVLFAENSLKTTIRARGEAFVPVPTDIGDTFSKSSEEIYAAAGVAMRFLEIYEVRLEYQRIFDAGLEETGGAGDLDVAALALTVTF